MENGWFVKRGAEKSGPFTNSQLKAMAATGQLKPSDLIAKKGMTKWAESSKVKGLFSAASVPQASTEPPRLGAPPPLQAPKIPNVVEAVTVSKPAPPLIIESRQGKVELASKNLPTWAWIGVAIGSLAAISFASILIIGFALFLFNKRDGNALAFSSDSATTSVPDNYLNISVSNSDNETVVWDVSSNETEQETLGAIAEVGSVASATTPSDDVSPGGDGAALHDMGHNYYEGIGVEQDFTQAAIYYQRAVNAGQIEALNDLAYMYAKGLGVAEDADTAAALFYKAASSGSGMGMFNYGLCLSKGVGVDQNEFQSRLWIQKSSEAGYQPAREYIAALQTQMRVQIFGAVLENLFSSGSGDYSQSDNRDFYTERRREKEYWEDRTRRAESAGDQMDADYSRRQIP